MVTALMAGIALPISVMLDSPTKRAGGVFGLVCVVVEFVLALSLIWGEQFLSGNTDEAIAFTMVAIALIAPTALGFAGGMIATKELQLAGRVGLGLAALAFLVMELGFWWQGSRFDDELVLSGFAIAGYGLLIVGCLVGVGGATSRWWRWVGVAGNAAACAVVLGEIWEDWYHWEEYVAALSVVAGVFAFANVILFIRLKDNQRWVRVTTLVCAWTASLLFAALLVADGMGMEASDLGDLMARASAAAAIAGACGTMALLVLTAINRRALVSDPSGSAYELEKITVVCPRCKKKQGISLGHDRCGHCDLRINITVEEPRCPKCDYLLFNLQSDRCPECGTVVSDASAEVVRDRT